MTPDQKTETMYEFSPKVAAGYADLASDFSKKLNALDPEADTSVIIIVVSNGFAIASDNTGDRQEAANLMRQAARSYADEDDRLEAMPAYVIAPIETDLTKV